MLNWMARKIPRIDMLLIYSLMQYLHVIFISYRFITILSYNIEMDWIYLVFFLGMDDCMIPYIMSEFDHVYMQLIFKQHNLSNKIMQFSKFKTSKFIFQAIIMVIISKSKLKFTWKMRHLSMFAQIVVRSFGKVNIIQYSNITNQ